MAMTAGSPVFVDTNVLVYARLVASQFHAAAVATLDQLTLSGVELWTSRQGFREYLATMTRPGTMTPPPTAAALVADIRGFEARFRVAEDGPAVTAELLRLLAAVTVQGRQVHDANIVATMLAHGVPNLLTHNAADFARYVPAITVVPLVPPSPAAPAPGSPTPGVP